VQAARFGAFDCIETSFTSDDLLVIPLKAQKAMRAQGGGWCLKETVHEPKSSVQSASPPLRFTSDDVRGRGEFEVLFRAAASSASILLLGESGTGKSVIGREIHERSHLRDKPFRTVSCPDLFLEQSFDGFDHLGRSADVERLIEAFHVLTEESLFDATVFRTVHILFSEGEEQVAVGGGT
jgi:DNA-binding NtrC family response regulator